VGQNKGIGQVLLGQIEGALGAREVQGGIPFQQELAKQKQPRTRDLHTIALWQAKKRNGPLQLFEEG
jgi:hypothetical protein